MPCDVLGSASNRRRRHRRCTATSTRRLKSHSSREQAAVGEDPEHENRDQKATQNFTCCFLAFFCSTCDLDHWRCFHLNGGRGFLEGGGLVFMKVGGFALFDLMDFLGWGLYNAGPFIGLWSVLVHPRRLSSRLTLMDVGGPRRNRTGSSACAACTVHQGRAVAFHHSSTRDTCVRLPVCEHRPQSAHEPSSGRNWN